MSNKDKGRIPNCVLEDLQDVDLHNGVELLRKGQKLLPSYNSTPDCVALERRRYEENNRWLTTVLEHQGQIAECIEKFYSEKLDDFYTACNNKRDIEVFRLLQETWWRNPHKAHSYGPSGWDKLCLLVHTYPD
jgi:hypothetical protein